MNARVFFWSLTSALASTRANGVCAGGLYTPAYSWKNQQALAT